MVDIELTEKDKKEISNRIAEMEKDLRTGKVTFEEMGRQVRANLKKAGLTDEDVAELDKMTEEAFTEIHGIKSKMYH